MVKKQQIVLLSLLGVCLLGCKEMPNLGAVDLVTQPMACTLQEGATRQLVVSEGTADGWYSEDTSVATVSESGVVTAQTLPDSIEYKVTHVVAKVGSKTASCRVNVVQKR